LLEHQVSLTEEVTKEGEGEEKQRREEEEEEDKAA
jgi:hypothetical protein